MTATDAGVSGLEAASEGDRLWFEDHPHRRHRIRPYHPGEGLPLQSDPSPRPGHALFIVVRQLELGVRVRLSFRAEGAPGLGEFAASHRFTIQLRSER